MNGCSLVIGKVFLTYVSHGDPWEVEHCKESVQWTVLK